VNASVSDESNLLEQNEALIEDAKKSYTFGLSQDRMHLIIKELGRRDSKDGRTNALNSQKSNNFKRLMKFEISQAIQRP